MCVCMLENNSRIVMANARSVNVLVFGIEMCKTILPECDLPCCVNGIATGFVCIKSWYSNHFQRPQN